MAEKWPVPSMSPQMRLEVRRSVERAGTSFPLASQRPNSCVTPQVRCKSVERMEALSAAAVRACIGGFHLTMRFPQVIVQFSLCLELGCARVHRTGENVGSSMQLLVRV